MRTVLLLVAFGFAAVVSNAQTQPIKIGFADVDYIFTQMPDSKRIETELASTQTKLKQQIDGKGDEFKRKLEEYNRIAQDPNTLVSVRQSAERDLQQLQQLIQSMQEEAQTTLQKKHEDLMKPVYDNVGKAIAEVAKENGFSLILTNQLGGLDVVLYGDDSLDISDVVLKKMNITPKPQTPQQPQTQQPTTPKK